MKKIILFAAILSTFSVVSCKKDRVCTCVVTSDAPLSTNTTEVTTYTKARKGDAKAACVSYSFPFTFLCTTYTSTHTCSLK